MDQQQADLTSGMMAQAARANALLCQASSSMAQPPAACDPYGSEAHAAALHETMDRARANLNRNFWMTLPGLVLMAAGGTMFFSNLLG